MIPVPHLTPLQEQRARIRVVGAGGAGGNAINHMQASGLRQVEFIAMNTDAQSLHSTNASRCIHLGEQLTGGNGAGGDPAVGARAAEESAEAIAGALQGTDIVFLTLGLGGGTGTGAGPVIARIARQVGALVVGVVTLPFGFEGRLRTQTALSGLATLREHVDTLITIPNERLITSALNLSLIDAFRTADDVLRQAVGGIADLVLRPGLINLDFADLRAIMLHAGTAFMSVGSAEGTGRAREAARLALSSPLLGLQVQGARGIVYSIAGSSSLTLCEVQEIAMMIQTAAHPDATLIFGTVIDETLEDHVRVTVIATGLLQEQYLIQGSGPLPVTQEKARPQQSIFARPNWQESGVLPVPAAVSQPLAYATETAESETPRHVPIYDAATIPPWLAQPALPDQTWQTRRAPATLAAPAPVVSTNDDHRDNLFKRLWRS